MTDQLDLFEYTLEGETKVSIFSNRMFLPGASQYCVDCQVEGGNSAWLRYLQDHATKTKQEQLAVNAGRHWGITGHKQFEVADFKNVTDITTKEYYRILRWLQRMATPRVPDPRAPFGRRAGYRITRGNWGSSV